MIGEISFLLTLAHIALAIILFISVNWIGKHAIDFGYASTTLFDEPNESIALNFFIRALAPAIFIIMLSAVAVSTGYPALRFEIYWVAIFYYVLRAGIIFAFNRHRLVSWIRFFVYAAAGLAAAILSYHNLIIPNRSLLPDLEAAGNELWLVILAFLYAVANNIQLFGEASARKRNQFVRSHFENAVEKFGSIMTEKIQDELLQLVAYSVLVFEDYARPPAIRTLERLMIWKSVRTTGIMQVASEKSLTDSESVSMGTEILIAAWAKYDSEEYPYSRVWNTLCDYNADEDYARNVMEIMEIIAKRVEPRFKAAYSRGFEE